MEQPKDLSRRDFTRAAVAAAMVPVLAPLASCAPGAPAESPAPAAAPPAPAPQAAAAAAPPAGTERPPTPLARALADAVRAQYGDRMTEAQMAKVQRGISGNLQTAERLRAFPLPIATEPAFVFRVAGGVPR
ncbi:MAG TPA: hypothetical protein VF665_20165 [Longimicrobium sp.]|jgi:hypothetical protein|uniref:hypothetical protein n=1 Tax=Longimicrobium sp. TaxID=2029185 RepID=UPI002EDA115A